MKVVKKLVEKWFGIYDIYRLTYAVYAIGGIWTIQKKHSGNSCQFFIFHNFLKVLILALYTWVLIAVIYDGYLMRMDLEKFTFNLSTSVFFITMCYRTVMVIPKKDELADCFDQVNNNFYLDYVGKSVRDVEILKEGERQMRILTKGTSILVTFTVISRGVCQLIPVEKSLMLPYPFAWPIPSPYFEILFTAQTIGLIHFVIVEVAYELVMAGFLIRIFKHFEIITHHFSYIHAMLAPDEKKADIDKKEKRLTYKGRNRSEILKLQLMTWEEKNPKFKGIKDRLERSSDCQNEETQRLLRQTIVHHQSILKVMKRLNTIITTSLFVQLFGTVLLIILLCADVIWQSKKLSSKLVSQTLYAGSALLDVTVLCYFGTQVEIKSYEAANALYDVPWLKMDVRNRRTAKFLLMALLKPPTLKAGRVLPINFKTYLKSMDLIYNSIAFMQNTAKRKLKV